MNFLDPNLGTNWNSHKENSNMTAVDQSVCVCVRAAGSHVGVCADPPDFGGPGQAPTQLGTLVSHTEAAALAWTGSVSPSELAFMKIKPCFHSCF